VVLVLKLLSFAALVGAVIYFLLNRAKLAEEKQKNLVSKSYPWNNKFSPQTERPTYYVERYDEPLGYYVNDDAYWGSI
jgi:hypothetical protein